MYISNHNNPHQANNLIYRTILSNIGTQVFNLEEKKSLKLKKNRIYKLNYSILRFLLFFKSKSKGFVFLNSMPNSSLISSVVGSIPEGRTQSNA